MRAHNTWLISLVCVIALPVLKMPSASAQDCTGEEICNGIDDDCDTVVDDGIPGAGLECGSHVGECEHGVTTCDSTLDPPAVVCVGAIGPVPEGDCWDGFDNDCDAEVDEGVPSCGTDVGVCEVGYTFCETGECVGEVRPSPEFCDGLDTDCDGMPDDELESPCDGEYACIDDYCRPTCNPDEEWPCPSHRCCRFQDDHADFFCLDDPCETLACDDPCTETCTCEDGCIDICDTVSCPPGTACEIVECGVPECDPFDCSTPEDACPEGERCVDGVCEPDPCWEVECGPGQFCREGSCYDSDPDEPVPEAVDAGSDDDPPDGLIVVTGPGGCAGCVMSSASTSYPTGSFIALLLMAGLLLLRKFP